ncbi:SDR family NAD(P)-dependent oxidoreductase [Mesonia ostreae]|uniref:SDR family oxidoreductase n=1 Tax=Mesonia ostreae TaxID=861110 RepID=A0ABU2KH60_9FLAO|nr:SDR family oxidoreductase [Mesonia ostreae]MDT0294009.1 SDR family oxidoreductase [Mesonia ostreae]
MSQKKVIITGTSRGIGFELAQIFAEEGHQVLALSRNHIPIQNLKHANIHSFSFNLNEGKDLQQVENFVDEQWEGSVDILIHNAGSLVNKPFAEITTQELMTVYQTNVFGVFQLNQRLLSKMPRDGHVVTISSMGGVQGSVKFPGLTAYSSSKSAVINLTEILAEEYKESGPSFNVLALGAVQTEMLQEAFPGYEVPTTAKKMAQYIFDFSLNGNKFYNGKMLQVSNSTP